MSYSRARLSLIVALVVAVAGACSDSTGSRAMGAVEVSMQQVSAPFASAGGSLQLSLSPSAATARVDKEKVDSLFVWVSRIGFLPVDSMAADSSDADSTAADSTQSDTTDADVDDQYPWIWMDLDSVIRIDLMALPADTDSVVVIGAGMVPAGDYRKVRMIVVDASAYFNDTISVGNQEYDVDTEYHVDVPSGAQSGLKTDIAFTVVADEGTGDPTAVNVLFDPNMTFDKVTATGSGRLKIKPVLKSR